MEQRQQKSSMILKYSKRRFDGGPEVEQIRNIERQQAIAQINRLHQQSEVQAVQAQDIGPVAQAPQAVAPTPVEPVVQSGSRKSKVLEATILGPMELCVGTVGMMTAGLAIFTFHRLNNQPLLKQSKGVFADCWKTFGKGVLDTITTPVRVLKAATAKV